MKTNNDLFGVYPDVAFRDGFLYIVHAGNGALTVHKLSLSDDSITVAYTTPCIGVAFPRILNVNGKIIFIWRDGSGLFNNLVDLDSQQTRQYPGVFYNWPVVLGKNAYAMNCNHNQQGQGDDLIHIYNYDGTQLGTQTAFPVSGIARINDDNSLVSSNDNRASQLDAWQLFNPMFAEELFCGSAAATYGVAVVANNSVRKLFGGDQPTYDPHITKYGDRWAIVTGDYTRINIFYDISMEDIIGIPVGYNPKPELIAIRAQLNASLGQLDTVISKLP